MTKIVFRDVSEFSEDLRKLSSKFASIYDDLELLKQGISAPKLRILGTEPGKVQGAVRISGLGQSVTVPIFKVKNFRCGALHGKGSRSGIRVIYAYEKSKGREVYTFIEIYFKTGHKENEDRQRILKYFGQRGP